MSMPLCAPALTTMSPDLDNRAELTETPHADAPGIQSQALPHTIFHNSIAHAVLRSHGAKLSRPDVLGSNLIPVSAS